MYSPGMVVDARREAARHWLGYGRWTAPYWFIGMEPGGEDNHASYESWLGLGGGGLIDCLAHHEDSNRRAGYAVTQWHGRAPNIQPTWGPQIHTMLAFSGRSTEDGGLVAAYQRDSWGRTRGETAVMHISAIHAANLDVPVDRMLFRAERLAEMGQRLREHRPKFVLFAGVTYRDEYQSIAGQALGRDDWSWVGDTLCVLAKHPASRPRPSVTYWRALGAWMRSVVAAGPGKPLGSPIPTPSSSTIRPSDTPGTPRPAVRTGIGQVFTAGQLKAMPPSTSLRVVSTSNHKRGASRTRFEGYLTRRPTTIAQALAAGLMIEDLVWDSARGFIVIG